jgi:hypothetical protein
MKRTRTLLEEIALLEPSFRPEEGSSGSFRIGEQRISLWPEPGDWLVASAPLSGSAEELLLRQAEIPGPVKITAGPALRVEWPLGKSVAESFTALRSALEAGLAALSGESEATADKESDPELAARWLAEHFAAGAWEWSQHGTGFLLTVEAGSLAQKVVVESDGRRVHFRAELVRLCEPEAVSRAALVHFLLELNLRLRFVRARLPDGRVALESVIPADVQSRWLVDKAVGALVVGARMARRECAALLDPELARSYCEFHNERR